MIRSSQKNSSSKRTKSILNHLCPGLPLSLTFYPLHKTVKPDVCGVMSSIITKVCLTIKEVKFTAGVGPTSLTFIIL